MKGLFTFFSKASPKHAAKRFFQITALASSISALTVAGFLHFAKPQVDISQLKNTMYQPTYIYDHKGELASTITANKSETIPIEKVPQHVKDAVVAIEDRRFYEHGGIDYKGIFRAAVTNLKAGGVVQGGSTLTQQLTKNSLLSSERTYKRKIKEYFLAKEVERKFTKDEILEMYLNQIYFGHGAWGIKKAAQIYFGKPVEDLTVSESALLAGLVKAPGDMDPYKSREKAIKRRNLVLQEMKEYKFIDKDTYASAASEKVTLKNAGGEGDTLKGRYPYYIDTVFEEAIKTYGIDQDELLTGGYKIYTALDQDMQAAAEEVYKEDSFFPDSSDGTLVQSGTVLINPKNGGINAVVGGRGEHTFREFNHATQLKRQPGSTMKPLAVYTPALEEGFGINASLKDEKMDFGEYQPSNYNDSYRGKVPMYEALQESLNVPAVWLLNEVGIQKGMDAVKRFGINLSAEDRKLGLALGGTASGVSPLDMAEAYSAFANDGVRNDSHAILKIVDAEGKEAARFKSAKTKVTSPGNARKMTAMLMGVVQDGTGSAAAVDGWEIAGKTGSTQVPIEGIDGVKDQWFAGYSPVVAGAVWLGYDHTDKDHYLTTTSSEGAAPLFREIMSRALQHKKHKSFGVKSIEEYKRDEREKEIKEFWNKQKDKVKDKWEKWTEPFKSEKEGIGNSDSQSPEKNEKKEPVQPEVQAEPQKSTPSAGETDKKEDDKEQVKPKPEPEPGKTGGDNGGKAEPPKPPAKPPAEPEPEEPEPETPDQPQPETPQPPEPEEPDPGTPEPEEPDTGGGETNVKKPAEAAPAPAPAS
ncbi:PBP1A family penicillin-binding protein [Peribacillus sp. SCS-26]|uniref:transglycosylase domain-containing protein n=1 Tax=Paraperibacillus marinus TaxID=3115295 RepID=UPI003906683A